MQTLSLIHKAEATGAPLASIARRIGLNPNALAVAKERGRLSPAAAAALAAHLGEPVGRWTLQAVIESERSAPLRRKLAETLRAISYLCPHSGRSLRRARFRPLVTVP